MGTTSQKRPCKNCGPQAPKTHGEAATSRQKANRELVKILHSMVEAYPDQRFSQLLRNLDVVAEVRDAQTGMPLSWANEFHLEPEQLLARVKKALQSLP